MNYVIDTQPLGDVTGIDRDEQMLEQVLNLRDHLRYQRTVMDQIFRLTDPRSITPLGDMQSIRIRALAALAALDKLDELK